MTHKLNVIAECWKGMFISPRKVREHVYETEDGRLSIYLTDFWLFHSRPGRPFKYRRAAAMVVRLAAYKGMPESCWEITNCSRIPTKEAAQSHYVLVAQRLLRDGYEVLADEMAKKWHTGRFVHRPHVNIYCAVNQEEKTDPPAGPHYKTFNEETQHAH